MKDLHREWVEYLRHHGESSWSAMPKMKNGKTVGQNIWKSMVRKGIVHTKYESGRFFRLPDQSTDSP